MGGMPTTTGTEWLIIREVSNTSPPVTVDVDRSIYLHFGDPPSGLGGEARTSFGAVLGQRSQATIALSIPAGDNYLPDTGWQVFLYEVTATTQQCVFCGTIDKPVTSWWGLNGERLISFACVSFEQVFGAIRVPGILYQQNTAGFIFTDLVTRLASGWPGTLGTIQAGKTLVNFLIEEQPTMSDIFDKLAQDSGYIWGVDPTNLEIYFTPPGVIAAPFVLMQIDPLYEQLAFTEDRHDFRDRQGVRIDYAKFGESSELFVGDGHSTTFTLRNPVHSVNDAWITRNTQNTATGTMSANPNPGDTASIGYPTSGSAYNWAPNSPYAVGYTIIDPSNHIQKVITVSGISPSGSGFGQSGPTQPAWNDVGGTTPDNGLVWQDQGLLGFGPNLAAIYTFVPTIDNTQYGQVLIDTTAAQTLQNLVDAINSQTSTRGVKYSLPTWENAICNADQPSGTTFTIRNKGSGQSNIASLASTGSAFHWSSHLTSGGTTTFNTTTLSIGINQPGTRTMGLSYIPGSAVVTLQSPLNVGTNLEVGYYRIDGDIINVENTPLVGQRAEIEDGTGKYQAMTQDDLAVTPNDALADAQALLTAFEEIPKKLEFITLRPGLRVGMSLSVGFTMPDGPNLEAG